MTICSLVYTSVANQRMSDDELKNLLKTSRQKNGARNITGMLLYLDPYFIQVLEGDETTVTDAFNLIKHDPRHQKVSIIYKKPQPERLFENWTMGFNKLTKTDIQKLDGFSDFLAKPTTEHFIKAPNRVTELLHSFRRETLF